MLLDHIAITVMSGADDGKLFKLPAATVSIVIGQEDPANDVCLKYDPSVQLHHARIAKKGSNYYIEDLEHKEHRQSKTYCDGEKILGETALSSGDMILLGKTWIKFEVEKIPVPLILADRFSDDGNKLYKQHRYEEAIGCYDRALEINKNAYYIWLNKGFCLYNLERYKEAIRCFDKVLKVDPDSCQAWRFKGSSLYELGRYDEEIDCYDEALKIDPKNSQVWRIKGLTLDELGRYDQAIECYDKALKIDPEYADTWHFKGLSLYNLERYREALRCFNKALKIDPDNFEASQFKKLSLQYLADYKPIASKSTEAEAPKPYEPNYDGLAAKLFKGVRPVYTKGDFENHLSSTNGKYLNIIEAVEDRINKLRKQLYYHSHRYHVLDSPEISDAEYDSMMEELRNLETEYPELIIPHSPTQRVGPTDKDAFLNIDLNVPLGSYMSVHYDDDFIDSWYKDCRDKQGGFVCELKISGLAVIYTYEKGKFALGTTRGDGQIGENLTQNLRTVGSVPLVVIGNTPSRFIVRGECFLPKRELVRVNEVRSLYGLQPSNDLHKAATWALRQVDPRVTSGQHLDTFVYQLILAEGRDVPRTEWQTLQWLRSLGLKVNSNSVLCHSLDEIREFYHYWEEKHDQLPYEVDGIVVKANSGNSNLVIKFPVEFDLATLEDISYDVECTGSIHPYAILVSHYNRSFSPSKADINLDDIRRKDIMIKDTVQVELVHGHVAEVVEPYKHNRIQRERSFSLLQTCPKCGAEITWSEGDEIYRCANTTCPAAVLHYIMHFASNDAMNIEGIGVEQYQTLFDIGLIKDAGDLYCLTREQLLEQARLREENVAKVQTSIETSKQRPLRHLIFALGIFHINKGSAARLVAHFGSLDKLMSASYEELTAVPNISHMIAESILAYFRQPQHQAIIYKLRRAGVRLQSVQ